MECSFVEKNRLGPGRSGQRLPRHSLFPPPLNPSIVTCRQRCTPLPPSPPSCTPLNNQNQPTSLSRIPTLQPVATWFVAVCVVADRTSWAILRLIILVCSGCVLSCTGHPRQYFTSLSWFKQAYTHANDMQTCNHTCKYANRHADMQIDMQTCKQTCKHAVRHADMQTDRQTCKHADRHANMQTECKQTCRRVAKWAF